MARIFIRVDGSDEIGLGHVTRCLALAQMLKNEFDILFILKNPQKFVTTIIAESGFLIKIISQEEQFFDDIPQCKIVVLDGYQFDRSYQYRVRSMGCKLVCIDDMCVMEFVADLIINHAPFVMVEEYKAMPYTRFAIGPEFALLRPSFIQQAKKERIIDEIHTVLICFGGSDIKNFTLKTLQVVLKFSLFKKIIVVTGGAYPYCADLGKILHSDERIEYHYSVSEEKMLDVMKQADLAIVPASGILYEIFCCGCVPLITFCSDNQQRFHDIVTKKFGIKTFKEDNIEFQPSILYKSIEDVLKEPKPVSSELKKKISLSTDKLANEMNLLSGENKFRFNNNRISFNDFKNLDSEELELVLSWRNSELVKKWMKTTHEISLTEHLVFVNNLKKSASDFYWMVYRKDTPCAVVYLNSYNRYNKTAEWGIYLGTNFIGSGVGLEVSFYSLKLFFEYFSIDSLIGIVNKNNIENLKLQQVLGFEPVSSNSLEDDLYVQTILKKNIFFTQPQNFTEFQKKISWKKK